MAAKSRFRSRGRARQDIGQVKIHSMALSETFEVDIPVPVGRVWATLALDMLDVVSAFQSKMDKATEQQNGHLALPDSEAKPEDDRARIRREMEQQRAMLDAVRDMFGEDKWWDELMPAAFGVLDSPDDTEFLQENFTMMELITAFFEAAGQIASVALGGQAVEEALGKSQDAEEVIEGEATAAT